MWAITSYFNPQNFQSRYKNYKIFREKLNIPLITVELSFNNEFTLNVDDADILLQVPNGDILWQKERMLNLALTKIPKSIENVAWIDCDVFFGSHQWSIKAIEALKNYNVIQLFSEAHFLKPDSKTNYQQDILESKYGLIASHNFAANKLNSQWDKKFHPGFAWAAKKSLLIKHQFYDSLIIGGGDSALSYALFGKYEASRKHHFFSKIHFEHYLKWALSFNKSVNNKIGFIDEEIFHLWHGKIKNRGYFSRNKALKSLNFNPYIDITLSKNGAWQWNNASDNLKFYLQEYFKNRREDDSFS